MFGRVCYRSDTFLHYCPFVRYNYVREFAKSLTLTCLTSKVCLLCQDVSYTGVPQLTTFTKLYLNQWIYSNIGPIFCQK